ncbi:MAG: glycine dehydrogenase (aminomethyl-transferring), partial [Elusimicrobia bacterium]|nr:glycine dehydrogenase (aminomethyl-transferring) [Elusimicrobiota bacterium]
MNVATRERRAQAALPQASDVFAPRHLGPTPEETQRMLAGLGLKSLEELADRVVPRSIRLKGPLNLPKPLGEQEALAELRRLASQNQVFRSYIGMGYHDTFTPPVILRNVLESPGWYTAYTPYQAEIAQGRLEALLNFQTMVADLTGLEVANASLLDEATAAAEAMGLARSLRSDESANVFVVSDACHPQTIEVVRTRARALGVEVAVADEAGLPIEKGRVFGLLLQYPATDGAVRDYRAIVDRAHAAGAIVAVAADLLALTLLTPPGEFGADIALGSTQRFGVPMGFGGPHAAYFAAKDAYKRQMPGRIVGVSKDAAGRPAYRLALQTREQHIRREKATSNITTNQTLLALGGLVYLTWLGPQGLRELG